MNTTARVIVSTLIALFTSIALRILVGLPVLLSIGSGALVGGITVAFFRKIAKRQPEPA